MLAQDDKAQVRDFDIAEHGLRRPVKKGLALQLDQRLGDHEAVVEKAGAAPAHGHDQMKPPHAQPSVSCPGQISRAV